MLTSPFSWSRALARADQALLHKKRELTAITLDFVPPEHWVVGGRTLAAQHKRSFYFDIKIVSTSSCNAVGGRRASRTTERSS